MRQRTRRFMILYHALMTSILLLMRFRSCPVHYLEIRNRKEI